jgi:hypothetical protein
MSQALARMPIRGHFIVPGRAIITHYGEWDTLLVRIGHRLWKWHKQEPADTSLVAALEDIWRVKREYRAPLVRNRAAMAKRMEQLKRGKAA